MARLKTSQKIYMIMSTNISNHQPESKAQIRKAVALSILQSMKIQQVINTNANILKISNIINNRISELIGSGENIEASFIHKLSVLAGFDHTTMHSKFAGKLLWIYNVSDDSINRLDRPLRVSPYRHFEKNDYRNRYPEALKMIKAVEI